MPTRSLGVSYTAPIRPDDYDIVLRARDAGGRIIEHTLAVRVGATIRVDDVGFQEGDFVAGNALVSARVQSPVPLAADDVEFMVSMGGGEPVPLGNEDKHQNDQLGKDWTVSGTLDAQGGQHAFALNLGKNGAQGLGRSWSFQVTGSGELALQQVAVYPNPFSDQTTFNYQLTNWADQVAIRVYTISGRLVREIEGSYNAGYSQVAWDGRDRDGDHVANGVYIYRIMATGSGREDVHTGKLIRSRR
jgi:hypothetical protein